MTRPLALVLLAVPLFGQTPTNSGILANPQPLTASQKFARAGRDTFGVFPLVLVAAISGIDQATNTPSEWGQGGAGFGRRFGSNFGVNISHQYFEATGAAILHEDPRYYISQDTSASARIKNAIKQTFVTRTDSGGSHFAFSRFAGDIGAGFLPNAWLPPSEGSAADGFRRSAVLVGIRAGQNLAREFIPFFRKMRP